ncbi:serine-rich adhesin for platelets-like [Adelges cooleyi]|uniref:serine-rich adhesin for platelets-like n=1 Tax=Adelges cooleyi TaxID=133065 RepID=UPI0021801E1A|nr:serine-rich adhesin for platelets-like [Adelges cooleyi]
MFSFLNLFNNSKPAADKKITLDPLSGKTLNLNSSEARALNIFNHKPPVSRRLNGSNTSFKNSNNNSSHHSFRDVYDKKRKLMESLDNFGIRKRTRQECGVDTFVNQQQKTIAEATDWVPSFNRIDKGNNSVVPQTVINAKTVYGNKEKKLIKRHGDTFNDDHLQKRPRTRNNEILSSYSSSKFLLTPGQKRTYPTDSGDDYSSSRKHCKSCTCCGSTTLLHNDKSPLNKSDKTTETDISDDLVTVAASRIFNRSGKTQVVKRISMKTILNEAFDDVDPEPFTSLEKIQQKKSKTQEKAISTNDSQDSSLIKNTNLNVSMDSVTTPVLTTSVSDSNQSKLTISSTTSSSIVTSTTQSVALSENLKENSEIDGKQNESQSSKNIVETPKTDFNIIKQPAKSISLTPKVNESSKKEIINTEKAPFQFSVQTSKSIEPISSSTDVSAPIAVSEPIENKTNKNQNLPIIQFGSQSPSEKFKENSVLNFASSPKQPTFTFGTAKTDNKQSTPAFQFGAAMQFGSSNVEKSTVPVVQFGIPKTDEKQPKSVAPNAPENTSAVKPVFSFDKNATENTTKPEPNTFQFGCPTKPVDSFPTTSAGNESKIVFGSNITTLAASPFSFGKPNEPKTTTTSVAPKFNLAQSTTEGSAPKLQFGAMSSSVFGNSSTNQTKTQLSNTVNNPGLTVKNQDNKLVFGSLSTEVKPATSTPEMAFNIPVFNNSSNNVTSPVFQFSSTGTKRDEKPLESSINTFQFPAAKSTPSFGLLSSPPSFVDKKAFEFNAQKTDDQKTQFSTPAFGSQNAASAPFKFGGSDKSTAFENTFTSPNQSLQFHNKTETKAEPFKFGAPAPANNAFQFGGANKANSEPPKFGQNTNAFNTSGFGGFGPSVSSQPTPAFGTTISQPQPSSFGNVVAPVSTSSFGNVAPPSSDAFGSSGGFQFGSTNNSVPSNPSTTFGFGGPPQPAKSEGAFGFNAGSTGASPFQFGQAPSVSSLPQFTGGQPQGAFGFGSAPQQAAGIQGSGQALFSMGAAPAGDRRKAKAVRRRNN